MKLRLKWMAVGAALLTFSAMSYAGGKKQDVFTVADLQKMVDELKPYLPEDPRLAYPIKCVVENKDDVNANASVDIDKNAPKDAKPQAKMTVYTGLLKFMKEIRLVRAVVAHELSHLSKQHLGKSFKTADLDLIFTRQQEYEADVTGAIALEKAGYSKKDMVDMLMKLGESSRDWPGSEKILGDHADSARRASSVSSNNLVLRSMVSFTDGEAYMDSRNYEQAMQAFDRAAKDAPEFYESKYNGAQASLLKYYSDLPKEIVEAWYVPDFGPSLKLPVWNAKAPTLTDGDRRNYAVALAHVKTAYDAAPKRMESLELQGLVLVLDPEGKSSNISEGINSLNEAMKVAMLETDKLRIANNLALGYQRSGNVNQALKTMFDSQRNSNKYNPFLAVNLGQQVPGNEFKSDGSKAEQVIFTYLTRTPDNAQGYTKALANYPKICQQFGLKVREIKPVPTYLCKVLTLTEKGKTVKILDTFDTLFGMFGKPANGYRYAEGYEGMKEYVWDSGNFSVIVDGRKVDDDVILEVLRMTSYTPGSYFDVKAEEQTVTTSFRVSVGMSVEEFSKFLDPKSGGSRSLVKAGTIEEWTYFMGLNMGVLIKDGKIAGITVVPT